MFKKITIILFIIALILTAFYGVSLITSERGTGQTDESLVEQGLQPTEDVETLLLPVNDSSEPLFVPNVFRGTEKVTPEEIIQDSVTGSTTAVLKQADTYALFAFNGKDGNSFMVAIRSENMRQARLDGEKELLSMLGITEQQACKTNITVIVDNPYDEIIGQRYVGLSFCPDRVDLPTSAADAKKPEQSAVPSISL